MSFIKSNVTWMSYVQVWLQWRECDRQAVGPHQLLHEERDEAGCPESTGAGLHHQRLQEGSDTNSA